MSGRHAAHELISGSLLWYEQMVKVSKPNRDMEKNYNFFVSGQIFRHQTNLQIIIFPIRTRIILQSILHHILIHNWKKCNFDSYKMHFWPLSCVLLLNRNISSVVTVKIFSGDQRLNDIRAHWPHKYIVLNLGCGICELWLGIRLVMPTTNEKSRNMLVGGLSFKAENPTRLKCKHASMLNQRNGE